MAKSKMLVENKIDHAWPQPKKITTNAVKCSTISAVQYSTVQYIKYSTVSTVNTVTYLGW
jgi:hypothetical protein